MRPTFLWSPDHRAGTDELLSRLLADAANGLDCVWLVPEPYSHSAERLLAERGGAPVCLRAEVITFRRLVDRVLAEAGGLARPVLDVGGRLLMLRRAVGAASGELTVLRRSAQKPAFLPDLLNTLDECKCYRITPQDLVRAADNAPPGVSDKLRDLGKLYAAYEEERGQLDPRDRVTLALEGAKTLKSFPILYVSDFASFTPQERLLLTGLSDKSPGLTVLFRGFFEGELSEPLRITAKQLATHYPQGVTHTPLPPSDTETALLPVVSPNPQLPAAHCPLSMELHSASCEASEVRFAAERILRLVREEGYRYRDIVVLTGDFESYAPLFESIFPLYGIPVFQDRMDTPKPLPRCIRAVGDCLRYGYRGDDVMRLLRSGLLPVPPADADLLENYLRRWNPRGSRFSGGRDWDRSPEGYGEPDERAREELIRLNALRRFLSSGMKRFQGDTAQKCAEGLYLALEALGVPEGLEIHRNALLAAGELKLANEVSQMWEIFVHTLEQCVLVLGDSPSDPSEFCNLCLTVLSGYSVGSIPASLDRVHVGDQGRMARIPVPAVLFLGADRVPASNAPGGLLSEEERKALSDAGCETPPDPPARIGRERLNLFTALTLPTRSLILTYPAAGAADPSPEWFGRLSALAGTPVTPVPPPTPPAAPAPLTFDAPLSGRNAAALYGQTLNLTASCLESFSLCPFHYFVRYGLSARPRPEPGFPPPDVGKELHLILAKCTRYASERGGFPNITKDELAHFAHTESAARLSALFAGTPRLLAQGRKIAETAKMLAGRLWEEFASSRFVPLDFELSLAGPPTPLTGVPPDAPSSYIPRGVADRVDVWRRDGTLYLRVVDYKSGKKTFSLTDVYHGVSAQMPFYLNLALESVPLIYPEKPADTQAAAALYIPSYDVSVRSSGPLTAEEAETAKAAALRHSGLVLDDPGVLAAMDSRLSSGVLPVTLNKDGTLSKKTLSASPEQMRSLQAHIHKLNDSTAFRIASGMVEANPLELRETPCDRCSCRAACHFDPSADPFRAVTALSGKDDFFNALLGGSHHASNP